MISYRKGKDIEENIFNRKYLETFEIKECCKHVYISLSSKLNGLLSLKLYKSKEACNCDATVRKIPSCKCPEPEGCFIESKNMKSHFIDSLTPAQENKPTGGFMKHYLGDYGGVSVGIYYNKWMLRAFYFNYSEASNCLHKEKFCRDVVFDKIDFRWADLPEKFVIN